MSKPKKSISNVEQSVFRQIKLPTELWSLFAISPLLRHEDATGYWGLLWQLANGTQPSDVIEWLWLKSVLDLIWEINRLHRLIAALIDAGRSAAVTQVFNAHESSDYLFEDPIDGPDDWIDPKKRPSVDARLEKVGLDAESIAAVSFSIHAVTLEAAEKMLIAKEIRLSKTLADMESRRARLGHLLREASEKALESQPALPEAKVKTDAAE
jgi:hypothetical protein